MSQNIVASILGLNTNANQIGKVPVGSLSIAKNIVIDKDGVAEPRRGFDYWNYVDAHPAPAVYDRITEFNGEIIAHRSDDLTMEYYSDGWITYNSGQTFEHPNNFYARMRFLKSNENLYFTSAKGVYVLDSIVSDIKSTGMPKGLDGSGSTTGASGFMSNNVQVAYRVVWGSKDIHNNLYLGAPSQRIIVANTSGATRDVSLTFTIPSGIITTDFFQVYRSRESASSTDEPNDELQLVYEANPTAGEITAKSITFTDSQSTTLMGAYLYTNSNQEGISQANDIPPFAKDLALFKNYTFYANTKTKQKLRISLLSVGGTNGLAVNDTITVDTMVFTAKAAENIASRQFKVTTTGSAAQNIEDTAKSLVKVINQYSSNTSVYAYYVSEYAELPGQILIEKRVIDDVNFSVGASRATAWDLNGSNSINETFVNGLSWSKIQQPEHVPAANLERVGSDNYEIRRILALRDSLFILKDDGVFRLTGSGGQWSIDPLDTSTKIIAPDSAVIVNNQIFCLSDQGVVAISDVGVEIKSIPIENQILELHSLDMTQVNTLSFGVAYETDRKYQLWTISSVSDTAPTVAYVYNTITNKWTTWEKSVCHGFVNPSTDHLMFCETGTAQILEERKSYTEQDYSDEALQDFSILSFSDKTIVFDSIVGFTVGDIVSQSPTQRAMIESIDVVSSSVTVNASVTWDIGLTQILKGIDCEIEFTNFANDNAGVSKHFQEIAWLFREKGFLFGDTGFYTDLSGGYSETEITGDFGGGTWGAFPWGLTPWGGILRPKPIRVFVPRDKSRGSLLSVRLKVRNAMSRWALNGISLQFEYVSERMTRE